MQPQAWAHASRIEFVGFSTINLSISVIFTLFLLLLWTIHRKGETNKYKHSHHYKKIEVGWMFGWILKTDWDIEKLMETYTRRLGKKVTEAAPVSGS